MFWNIFSTLCAQNGISPNTVAKSLSIASGSVTKWKNGATPQNATLKKIAQYFNVSVEYLLTGKEKTPEPTPSVVLDSQGLQLTPEEVQFILSYRTHPDLQPVVRKLLDIPEGTEKDTDVVS